MRLRVHAQFTVIVALATAIVALGEGQAPASAQEVASAARAGRRIVAIGDVHGDLAHTRESLKLAGVIDASDHWVAGNATFVQTGDVMDRGDDVRAILDLLRNLEKEASAAGGRAIELIGNHEMFNLVGDQASASPADMASFGGEEARRAAFSPSGDYGAWLRTHKAVVIVDDTVFVHGGITPEMARLGEDAMNAGVLAYLNGGPQSSFVGRDGPLWFRGYAREAAPDACSLLGQALETLHVRRMVVGHTPSDDGRVIASCEGRVIDIDSGISASFGTHPSALEITDGDAWATYATGKVDLPDPK